MHPTLLIGLDGATFTILDILMEQGVMPFLSDFVRQGVRAELRSTVNPLTPPAWTTLMTGRTPGNHGIIDFIWAEQRTTDHYFTLYNFRDIQCETIWSMVSRQGGRVCSLNFPIMAPPPAVNGFVVPGLVSWKHLRRSTHPQEIYEELKTIPDFNPREFAWDFALEKEAAKGVPAEEFENWVYFHRRREQHWFNITRQIMSKGQLDLAAILFDGMDKMLHIGWRLLDPACFSGTLSDEDNKVREHILGYFRDLDGFLADLCEMAGPDARVVLASDHGFGPAYEVFRVNTWLEQEGYLVWKDLESSDAKTQQSVQRLVDQHFVHLDWEKTTAYARSTTSNGIYIRQAKSGNDFGVPADKYEVFRNELRDKLLKVENPDTGRTIVKQVFTREEAYPGANNGQAPDLTLVMRDHSFISILRKEPCVATRPHPEGTHYPQGVFIARGPGFPQGVTASEFSICDITPILLYSLGLPISEDIEGRIPPGVFEEACLKETPIRKGPPTLPPDSYAVQGAYHTSSDEENAIMNQMKALGYIE